MIFGYVNFLVLMFEDRAHVSRIRIFHSQR